MEQIKVEKIVDASKEDVWAVLANFDGVYQTNPYVVKSYSHNGKNNGLGAERHCELNADGSEYSQECVVEWCEGKGYAIEMIDGTSMPPVNDLRINLGVEAIDDVHSQIVMSFDYQPKWGIIGQIVNPIIFKPLLRKIATNTIMGFKYHIETGQTVDSMKTLSAIPIKSTSI